MFRNRDLNQRKFFFFCRRQTLIKKLFFSDSNDLSLAFANRSACYQKMRGYDLAVRDIELALSSGYPEDKAFKLYERKGKAL